MHKSIIILITGLLISCNNYSQLKPIAELPKKLNENSGIATFNNGKTCWFVNDSGNKNNIYEVDNNGEIINKVEIENAKNVDWEELTQDDDNNVYIGDFGNNYSERKDLTIYIIKNPENAKDGKTKAEKITFNYPEQTKFKGKKKDRIYDSEAFIYLNGNLYIFTKDRSKPYRGKCFLYKLPAKPGNYEAELIDTYEFSDNYDSGSITSAAIDATKQKIVLLTHQKVYLLEDFTSDDFFDGTVTALDMEHSSQKESICFKNDKTLLISDEAEKKGSGILYEFTLP